MGHRFIDFFGDNTGVPVDLSDPGANLQVVVHLLSNLSEFGKSSR